MENTNQSAGLFNYQIGNTPNVPMLFVGYCCCCGVGSVVQLHNVRNELKKFAPEINDSMHWPMVIISIWGMFVTHSQLTALEKENNIDYTTKIPIILLLLIPPLWPFALAEMMNRLNALAQKKNG